MIKIRLHGTAEEVRHATREIKERFDVLNVSEPYADRGESVYSRVYIDAETKNSNIPIFPEVVPKPKVGKTCAVAEAELKERKMFQGLVSCDREPNKRDCPNCPYFKEKTCLQNLLFDCSDYIAEQVHKELKQKEG